MADAGVPDSPTSPGLRPGTAPRLAVLTCVGVAALAMLIRYPQAVADLNQIALVNGSQSFTDREIAGGNAVIPDQALMYAARAIIPRDAGYEAVIGELGEGWSSLTSEHAAGYIRYFLIPRRTVAGAPWIICLGCDRDALGGEIVWEGDDGLSILRRDP